MAMPRPRSKVDLVAVLDLPACFDEIGVDAPDRSERTLPLQASPRAFDRNILGVHPDLHVEIRIDVLREEDGPKLEYRLQGFHNARIVAPRAESLRPNRGFLEERYDIFRRA